MAIVFTCPHCNELHRLKDELAGKQGSCKNPECRQVITIPHPVTVPEDAAELEAAALAALAEEAPKQEEAPVEQVIPVTCSYCGHHFTVPRSMAGKNTLCQNPECRQRLKVPEPKDDQPQDWRQAKTKLPSLAKQNEEKLEGVQGTANTTMVSGKALREADATGEEYEPRPLKQKVMFGVLGVGFLASMVFGVSCWMHRGTQKEEDQLMVEARKQFDEKAGELAPAEVGLCSSVLNTAAAEYALRQNTPEKLTQAKELLGSARDDLRKTGGPARNAVLAEVALLVVAFGGTDEQVKEQTRLRWQPELGNHAARVNEKVPSVHAELVRTLRLLGDTPDFEFKITVARQLTRKLAEKGQAELAADLIPLSLFKDPEKDEARAVIALEIRRLDPASPLPRDIANELKTQFAGGVKGNPNPYPASAQTLFAVTGTDVKPPLVQPWPPSTTGTGVVDERACLAYVGVQLIEGKPDEAVKLAARSRTSESKLKALLLCAEWGDPGAALDAALDVMKTFKSKREQSQAHILRLSQIAAASGRHDQAKALAEALNDEGLREWAKGDIVRQRVTANPKDKADEAWVELPPTSDKLRAGQAWGRLWVARQNAKLSGDREGEKRTTAGWTPAPIQPLGLAGIALGLQDR